MSPGIKESIDNKIAEIRQVWIKYDCFSNKNLERIVDIFSSTLSSGNRVAFIGNGGSASEAMHLAAEFTGRCVVDHKPLPVICLNESQSSITAIGNDYGFEYVFARQVQAHLRSGDLLIALSTSGRSKNILEALRVAVEMKVQTMLWMGDFGVDLPGVEVFKVPSNSTPRIQEVHLAWGHLVAEVIESNIYELGL